MPVVYYSHHNQPNGGDGNDTLASSSSGTGNSLAGDAGADEIYRAPGNDATEVLFHGSIEQGYSPDGSVDVIHTGPDPFGVYFGFGDGDVIVT
jgi:hypothetical protein